MESSQEKSEIMLGPDPEVSETGEERVVEGEVNDGDGGGAQIECANGGASGGTLPNVAAEDDDGAQDIMLGPEPKVSETGEERVVEGGVNDDDGGGAQIECANGGASGRTPPNAAEEDDKGCSDQKIMLGPDLEVSQTNEEYEMEGGVNDGNGGRAQIECANGGASGGTPPNVASEDSVAGVASELHLELKYRCDSKINHLDLLLLGSLNVLSNTTSTTKEKRTSEEKERERVTAAYRFRNQLVCVNFFSKIHSVSVSKIKSLKRQLASSGVFPKMHGNTKRKSKELPFEQKTHAVAFIRSYAEQHALVLPGRTPYHKDYTILLLPCSMSKKRIYEEYVTACSTADRSPIKLWMWYDVWKQICSNIVIQKPRTDLCPTCQSNVLSLGSMAALSEEEKAKRIRQMTDHLKIVTEEREYYCSTNETIREYLKTNNITLSLRTHPPQSYDGIMHYAFDFAQQVHIPFSSQQVGPLYFLTGYKVSLFGIACEPLGAFVLYIIPESCFTGKGSNFVISLLHHFFETYGLGESNVICHADNCSGQNKNNFLMQYASWRVMSGLHKSFKMSFLPVGHTKFAPDLYFGLFKRCFQKSDSNCLKDVFDCATNSTPKSNAIIPVLVGDEDGNVKVKTYDWQTFFSEYKPKVIPSLLQYSHFRFADDILGRGLVKKSVKEETETDNLIFDSNTNFNTNDMPSIIEPTGLSAERKQYLYNKIRPYTAEYAKDILCPPIPSHSAVQELQTLQIDVEESVETPDETISENIDPTAFSIEPSTSAVALPKTKPKQTRKQPTCGYCQQIGHRNQCLKGKYTCPERRQKETGSNASRTNE